MNLEVLFNYFFFIKLTLAAFLGQFLFQRGVRQCRDAAHALELAAAPCSRDVTHGG